MHTYSSDVTVIPSLTFTKAELAYILLFLTKTLPLTNNSTLLEMVEMRHYLNLIKDKVLLSTYDGSLKKAMQELLGELPAETDKKADVQDQNKPRKPSIPSVAEMKAQFPTLSEAEINEILTSTILEETKRQAAETATKPKTPPPPSLSEKPHIVTEDEMLAAQQPQQQPIQPSPTPQQEKHTENTRKFAQLLGGI